MLDGTEKAPMMLTDLLDPKGESDPYYKTGTWYELPADVEWNDVATQLLLLGAKKTGGKSIMDIDGVVLMHPDDCPATDDKYLLHVSRLREFLADKGVIDKWKL